MWDWPLFAAIAIGIGRAIERARPDAPPDPILAKALILAWWLGAAAFQTDTIESFAVFGLVPLGAYKVADVATAAALVLWKRLRIGGLG